MVKLEVDDLHKRYGAHEVLKGVSLKADAGDVISVIGSSGSGKRHAAALHQPARAAQRRAHRARRGGTAARAGQGRHPARGRSQAAAARRRTCARDRRSCGAPRRPWRGNARRARSPPFWHAQHVYRHLDHVLQRGHVRPQVEMLEHHGQARTHALQLFRVGGAQGAVFAGHQFQLFVIEQDLAGVGLLQQVDAAQKVLLPEPLEPMMLITSPAAAARDTPLSTS